MGAILFFLYVSCIDSDSAVYVNTDLTVALYNYRYYLEKFLFLQVISLKQLDILPGIVATFRTL